MQKTIKEDKNKYKRVILIGNPNVGKSVIFGLLTGKYVTVSNYPGTTVEVSRGNLTIDGKNILLIDSPGVNGFIPMSEDEQVTRDILLNEKSENVVLVADSKNLKRAMMLLIQLSEMELPCILVLNMEDEAKTRGIEIDYKRLEDILGIRVIGTVAPQRKGIGKLKDSLLMASKPKIRTDYGTQIEEYLQEMIHLLPEANISRRAIGLMILAGDKSLTQWCISHIAPKNIDKIEEIKDRAQARLKQPISTIISARRIAEAEKLTDTVQERVRSESGHIYRWLGRITMHPVWGLFFVLFSLFVFYEFVGKFGAGILVDFFQNVIFKEYLNPAVSKAVNLLVPTEFFRDLFVGQYGIFTMAITYAVAIILPITATFFIAFGFLEDSGYLPRIAVLTNSAFSKIGLNGKAVLPLVLGLGCGTMATMTTRILETKRERLIATFLIALAIPCSAQLGVILGMLGPYSAKVAVWWIGTILLVLLVAGTITSRVLPGSKADFFLEIPPMRLPRFSNIIMKTIGRIEWYLKEAVPLFVLGTLILFILDKTHLLKWIENAFSPIVVRFLGLPKESTTAFIMGFLRRDYGAAGLFELSRQGLMNENQVIVSIITLTLFIPCLASFFMIIKERGIRSSAIMFLLITVFALLIGGGINFILSLFSWA